MTELNLKNILKAAEQLNRAEEKELENLKLLLGLTDVEGTGLVITLKDPDNITEAENNGDNSVQRITASQLMIIVNYLKAAICYTISWIIVIRM